MELRCKSLVCVLAADNVFFEDGRVSSFSRPVNVPASRHVRALVWKCFVNAAAGQCVTICCSCVFSRASNDTRSENAPGWMCAMLL